MPGAGLDVHVMGLPVVEAYSEPTDSNKRFTKIFGSVPSFRVTCPIFGSALFTGWALVVSLVSVFAASHFFTLFFYAANSRAYLPWIISSSLFSRSYLADNF